MDLVQKLRNTRVAPGQIAVCPLGQAGFIYKTASERCLVIDPYLTDYCEHKYGPGFKRMLPALMTPEQLGELPLAAYLITHHHIDHLDAECVDRLIRAGADSFPFYAPPAAIELLLRLGIAEERCFTVFDGSSHTADGIRVSGVYADHGPSAPDAVGLIVQSGERVIYHMGDTGLREEPLREVAARYAIDLLIAPINGMFGNMNEAEAAAAAAILKPKQAVPCHYWMLPGNAGSANPARFVEAVAQSAPGTQAHMPAPGDILLI